MENTLVKKYTERLVASRIRILMRSGFYGLLLMHLKLAIDEKLDTAATDGERIFFGTKFLDKLSDEELDFIMMHELLHVVLQHCFRGENLQHDRYNVACDIVINSTIFYETGKVLNCKALGGIPMHLTPKGKDGYLYTAEEVYEMLPSQPSKKSSSGRGSGNGGVDDHSKWGQGKAPAELKDAWNQHIIDAAISIEKDSDSRGTIPAMAQRIVDSLRNPSVDWRTLLSDFITEEICDYSFSPPDRRFSDSPFFLPDFNDIDQAVHNVLFMCDTSGSISDGTLAQVLSEVVWAIGQFGGKLSGKLGFFDAEVYAPVPFANEHELRNIKPKGGGGTNFEIIFEYVSAHMMEDPPIGIIILTDGYAPFPEQSAALGIPVLWLIVNEEVTPPWGRVGRVRVG